MACKVRRSHDATVEHVQTKSAEEPIVAQATEQLVSTGAEQPTAQPGASGSVPSQSAAQVHIRFFSAVCDYLRLPFPWLCTFCLPFP